MKRHNKTFAAMSKDYRYRTQGQIQDFSKGGGFNLNLNVP